MAMRHESPYLPMLGMAFWLTFLGLQDIGHGLYQDPSPIVRRRDQTVLAYHSPREALIRGAVVLIIGAWCASKARLGMKAPVVYFSLVGVVGSWIIWCHR